ncbi:MAG: phosphatidylserine/phosphatidylglycerophosphate/cardiolipin synthase family protein [Clostridia bacterium]|nr:phosphatidylserine/phosphatidylglycerophosphate/cardiolipin synthase family protein [Clostridia bacterium]
MTRRSNPARAPDQVMAEVSAWAAHPPKGKHTVRRVVLLALAAYLVYFFVGFLAPFAVHPEVNETFQSSFDLNTFYGEGSPDRAALVLDNGDALDMRLRMIGEAKERIILASFDMRDCESSRDIFAALLLAADRGVDIKILVDGANGLISMSSKPMFHALGRLPNVEIKYYNTPNPFRPWTLNGRMHDKYVIVDDRLLLLGGRNTFDLFLGDYVPDNLKSHDQDVLVVNTAAGTGDRWSALWQVEDYFDSIWDGPHAQTHLDVGPLFPASANAVEEELRARYQAIDEERPELFAPEQVDYSAVTVPVEKATLLHNPTNILAKEPWVWWQIQQCAEAARDRVVLMTPYAVLSDSMYDGLSRISDKTTLFLNSIAVGDNFMASSDYLFRRDQVMATGVTVAEWFGDYSSHGKAALFDDDLSMIGSYNWDMRSTYIDTELMLVFHGEEFARLLKDHLAEMSAHTLVATAEGYLPREGVEEKEPMGAKAFLLPITSVLFQPFRFLL